MIYIHLGSQSRALQVQKLLSAEGIPASVVNTPKALKTSTEGCGYSVSFPSNYRETADRILRRKGISAPVKEF